LVTGRNGKKNTGYNIEKMVGGPFETWRKPPPIGFKDYF